MGLISIGLLTVWTRSPACSGVRIRQAESRGFMARCVDSASRNRSFAPTVSDATFHFPHALRSAIVKAASMHPRRVNPARFRNGDFWFLVSVFTAGCVREDYHGDELFDEGRNPDYTYRDVPQTRSRRVEVESPRV